MNAWIDAQGLLSMVGAATAAAQTQPASHISEGMALGWIAAGASLVGALIGAAIPAVVSWSGTRRQRKDDLGYLAVTVSATLDRYIGGCIDVMHDEGVEEDGQDVPRVSSPELELGSLDVNWRAIPATLLDRIFAIPNAQQIVQDRLAWEAEFADYPILIRQIEYGTLAEKALDVVAALRKSAALPPSPEGRLDYAGMIERKLPELKESHEIAETDRRIWQSVFLESAAPEGGSTAQ